MVPLKTITNLVDYGRYIAPGMFTDESPYIHFHMSDQLLDFSNEHTAIMTPRDHAKSSLGTEMHSIWHIFEENRYRFHKGLLPKPDLTIKYIVIVSKTQREAKNRLGTIKYILGTRERHVKEFRKAYGNWGEETALKWTEDTIILKNGTVIRAIGTGQQVRGTKTEFQRPTLILVDDPEDEANTKTPEAMQYNLLWLEQAAVGSLSPGGRIYVIGTPLNTECMVARLMTATGWHSIWYQNDAEENTSRIWNNEKGEWDRYEGVLWPSRRGRDWLLETKERLKGEGLISSYYREHEAKIMGDEDQIFLPEYDRFWRGELKFDLIKNPYLFVTHLDNGTGKLKILKEPKKIPVLMFVGIDPASSTAAGADKSAVVNIAFDADENIYHLPYIHERLKPADLIESIALNHKKNKPFRGVAETVSGFEFVQDFLWSNHRIRYIPDKPRTKKKGEGSRLERLHIHASRGKIFFQPEMHDLIDQHHMYPRGKDDLMDAEEKAVRYATTPIHEVVESANHHLMLRPRKRHYDAMTA